MAERDNTWDLNVNLHQFPRDTLKEIKLLSDKHNGSREWLANIYHKDGKYILGSPVFGNYSGVSMKPDEQSIKDRFSTGMKECVELGHEKGACRTMVSSQPNKGQHFSGGKRFGSTPEDLVSTIHLHPIRSFETSHNKEIRSQFSGTDIGSEFAKAVRDDKTYRLFLTYPEMDGSRRHNILKMIVFPGKKSMEVMKKSNPHLSDDQIWSITPEGKGIDVVDWYAYQDESKRRGLIQELDIEKATGAEAYRSYGNYYVGAVVVGAILALAVVYIINKRKKKKDG